MIQLKRNGIIARSFDEMGQNRPKDLCSLTTGLSLMAFICLVIAMTASFVVYNALVTPLLVLLVYLQTGVFVGVWELFPAMLVFGLAAVVTLIWAILDGMDSVRQSRSWGNGIGAYRAWKDRYCARVEYI